MQRDSGDGWGNLDKQGKHFYVVEIGGNSRSWEDHDLESPPLVSAGGETLVIDTDNLAKRIGYGPNGEFLFRGMDDGLLWVADARNNTLREVTEIPDGFATKTAQVVTVLTTGSIIGTSSAVDARCSVGVETCHGAIGSVRTGVVAGSDGARARTDQGGTGAPH